METKIDWQAALDGSRPVTTRDGCKVVLYCVDAPGEWPVHGRIEEAPGPSCWRRDGTYQTTETKNNCDLIQAPRRFKYERWVNVYADGSTPISKTRADADWAASPCRIACVKVIIEGEEGEGLE
ncbi:hypothetical protein [Ferrovibrio sp.]|uniref:hypothetical protein n=1 Tax=Ferrovibrio sp. TaxID=1917215 RepID=UPI0035AF61D2